jgi:heme/copper-type cytochrome/quinol oxidase subunit 3
MEKNKLGMICFIGSEAVFFTMLILAYPYFRGSGFNTPNAKDSLDITQTAIFSICLFSSSFTMWQCDRNLAKGRQRPMLFWLILTVVLGATFLIGQGVEYSKLLGEGLNLNRNLFGTTFFTLTGFHGLHVFIGLVALATLAGLGLAGMIKGPKSAAVEAISLYWHFVDVVWVIIFSMVYLWAYFA